MSKQDSRIAWFIALSVAIHATVLLIGNRPVTPIGPAERAVQVSMRYRADLTDSATPAVNPAGQSRHNRRQPPATNRPTPSRAASEAIRRHHGKAPRKTTTSQSVTENPAQDTPVRGQSAPVSDPSGTARQSAEAQLRSRILRLVSSHFDYPVLARRKGWQGIVKLQVHIESDGRISRLHVEQTSGYPVLDQAALQSLQLASVPDAEQWLQGQAMDIIIPVEYRLVGG
jgi:protein TonB